MDFERIKDRDRVSGTFLVQEKQVPLNRNGKAYISMVLMNRSGSMAARVWDNVEQLAPTFDAGDFIEIRGVGVEYQNKVQLKVDWLARIDPASVNAEDFLPASRRDRGEMLARLRSLVESIQLEPLRSLILRCLQDDSFREKFARSPAAKTIHHAFLGGLLEHTLTLMELADQVCRVYPLDRDLLIAGAFFHDVGKIRELGQERSFEYTDEGRLIGHIVMGASLFSEWVQSFGRLPHEVALKLTHMILSHHGSYEFGSPKRPKFAEALILNYLDEMDSKIQALKEVTERETGQKWSSFQKLFDRYFYLGETAAEESRAHRARPPTPAPADGETLTHRPFDALHEPAAPKASTERQRGSRPLDLFSRNPQDEEE